MSGLRVLVAGELVGAGDHGGATWAMLQWVLGVRALGHEVLAVEPSIHPSVDVVRAFHAVADAHGLARRAALVTNRHTSFGVAYRDIASFARHADIVVNLSGRLRDPELLGPPAARVYVDLDPGFTQIWHAQGHDMGLSGHDVHCSVGAKLAALPDCGVVWHHVLPPVALDHWPMAGAGASLPWTTVANLRSYGPVTWHGERFGQKVHALRGLASLPQHSARPLAIALRADRGDARDVQLLKAHGWRVLDATSLTGTPAHYRSFVRRSFGEIGVAKEGYVVGQCGWVSDRTACYLASGRPAVVHDTGLVGVLPTGVGLLTFTTIAEARAALGDVAAHYDQHRRVARELAAEHFDARRVIARVIDLAGVRA